MHLPMISATNIGEYLMTMFKAPAKFLLLAFLTVFMAGASADGIPLMYLEGEWVSSDYTCTSNHTEKIAISISGNDLKAVKTDSGGDTCVPTGNDTFRGSLPNELSIANSFPVVIVLGWPDRPACCTGRAYIVMQDVDNFKVCLKPDCSQRGWDWVMRFSRINFVPQL